MASPSFKKKKSKRQQFADYQKAYSKAFLKNLNKRELGSNDKEIEWAHGFRQGLLALYTFNMLNLLLQLYYQVPNEAMFYFNLITFMGLSFIIIILDRHIDKKITR